MVQKSEIKELATELKALFPKGKKPGTNIYWAGGVALIEKRLVRFFEKYGNDYTKEDIIRATKQYVSSYEYNPTIMRTLMYFIYKDDVVNGETIYRSDLLDILENQEEDVDLTGELRI